MTGAAGFAGRNLVENLKNIRDGKNRNRSALHIGPGYEYVRNTSKEDIDCSCSVCYFVSWAAGVNWRMDKAEFI